MLLKSYSKEITRPKCNPSFESLHCIADLDQDVFRALNLLPCFRRYLFLSWKYPFVLQNPSYV